MIVTNLKQGVKNPNRVNVFVDGKFSFSLDVAQVVDFKIKVGMKVSEETLAELKKASEFGKLYQRALEWVLVRPRSVRETRDYLVRKLRGPSSGALRAARPDSNSSRKFEYTSSGALRAARPSLTPSEAYSEFAEEIIERLRSRGYLDDRKFAEFWVENRFVKKGVSRKRLKMELMKKGVAREVVDEVLSGRDDEEEILKIIARKRAKYTDEKLISYLVRQGFSFELARNLVLGSGKD